MKRTPGHATGIVPERHSLLAFSPPIACDDALNGGPIPCVTIATNRGTVPVGPSATFGARGLLRGPSRHSRHISADVASTWSSVLLVSNVPIFHDDTLFTSSDVVYERGC
jgi:hypothetical protein